MSGTAAALRPAVFVDRDGTVSEEIGYVDHVSRFRLLPRSSAGIRLLNELCVPVVMVTNQAGAARGYFRESMIDRVHETMTEMLARDGARVDGIYHCPHHPGVGPPHLRIDCDCRKPRPGLVERACRDLGLDPARSFMVGDKNSDAELARRVGAVAIHVLTGYGRGEAEHLRDRWKVEPDHVVGDLFDAALVVAKALGLLGRLPRG